MSRTVTAYKRNETDPISAISSVTRVGVIASGPMCRPRRRRRAPEPVGLADRLGRDGLLDGIPVLVDDPPVCVHRPPVRVDEPSVCVDRAAVCIDELRSARGPGVEPGITTARHAASVPAPLLRRPERRPGRNEAE